MKTIKEWEEIFKDETVEFWEMEPIESLFDTIKEECKLFQEKTTYDVHLYDVIFSYGNPDCILNDWDEGKDNDPFWNEELNCHSAYVFIEEMAELIKRYFEK